VEAEARGETKAEPEAKERITVPVVMALAGTRVLAGIGIGLLLSDRMDRSSRRTVGRALLAAGIASTMPLLRRVAGWRCPAHEPA